MEITEIKQQLTLAQVLQHYGLKPDRHLRMHCPFHDDKTPSLQVYYKTHTAYCFSSNCKTHGKAIDVIDFVMHKENCTKHEAIEKCKQLIGGTVSHPAEVLTRVAVLTKMFTYFKNGVHNSKPAQQYIASRTLDHTKLEIGYNTGQFHHGQRKEEALIKSCLEIGLLSRHDRPARTGEEAYRPFAKHSIVFALRNKMNQVAGLYFRSTINDSDQRHFYLKDRQGLYPKYPEAETTKLILTESIIDAATLLQSEEITGDYSVLALYGTNGLTQEHIAAIQELQHLREIILWLNADEAGEAAVKKHSDEFKNILPAVKVTCVSMPAGEDINSLAQAHSDQQIFTSLLNGRKDFFLSTEKTPQENEKGPAAKLIIDSSVERKKTTETKQQHTTNELDTSNPLKVKYTSDTAHYYIQGGIPRQVDNMKIMLVIESKETTLKARNRIDLYEDKQVERLCKEVAEKLSMRRDLLEADLYRLTDLLDSYRENQQAAPAPSTESGIEGRPLTARERSELESFCRKPKLIKRLNELLGNAGIVGEERNRIFLLVIAISHKMPETLHALIQGSSGSGKTRLLKQITDCMPKENVTKLTRLSDKVLYNYPENYFVNRLLCLEDIDGLSEEAEFAFRELQSNGELNSATSIKLDNGQITSGQKTVKGPIASLACTTHGEIYEDNMSRVFLIAVDESTEQTKRIIEYQNSKAAGQIDHRKEQEIKTFLQNLVCILKPCEVINPYAAQIELPQEAHKIRRLNDLFQGFVKMITILNQYQRKKDERGRLITEISDIETAVAVMFESIVLKVDELDGSLRHFFEQLKNYLEKKYTQNYRQAEFSLREIRQALKTSKTQVFRYTSDLTRLEYIRPCGGYSNKGYTYKICYWDNYEALREKLRLRLDEQVKSLKSGTLRNATGTLEPA
jgi:DNA primase